MHHQQRANVPLYGNLWKDEYTVLWGRRCCSLAVIIWKLLCRNSWLQSTRGGERERGESSLGNVRTFYNYMTCVGRLENFEPDLD